MDLMCHSPAARPPLPPIRGGSTDDHDLVLTAADGNRLAAYAVRAAEPTGAGIVVMPDVRGLHPFYKDLARRFAQAGVDAVAIDYFGRTAGVSQHAEGFDFMGHVRQTTVQSVFTVGFCFGGSQSWRQSAGQPGLSGAIGLYGRPAAARDAIPAMRAPLLLLVAGADAATSQEEADAFDRDLTQAGIPHRRVVYQGAPHSFFDRTFDQYRAQSDDAWRQMLAFIKENTRQPTPA